jgi:hypothetical protein
MADVVRYRSESFQRDPRRIIVSYLSPVFADLWTDSPIVEEVLRRTWTAIYETQGRALPKPAGNEIAAVGPWRDGNRSG